MKTAMDLSQAGNREGAIEHYTRAIQLDPQNLTARYFRGSCYASRGGTTDLWKALNDFDVAGNQAPDYVLLHFKKAEVLGQLKLMDKCKTEMRRAVQLDPALAVHLDEFKRAKKLADGGNYSKAVGVYQRLFFDYPTCVPIIVDYANCQVMLKEYPDAVTLYALALGFDPDCKEAADNLEKIKAMH